MKKLIIYNHGKDSIPCGEKPLALAEVAKRHGYEFVSPDYQASNNPEWRVQQLLKQDVSEYDRIALVGSSMGAYVATVAAEIIKPQGLFLIAPAFYLPGYAHSEFSPPTTNIEVFHGWQDGVVPPENSWRFCRQHHARLHMLDADHRLLSILPLMAATFAEFLLICDN
jgi:alpha/beta superfamily hydrolase